MVQSVDLVLSWFEFKTTGMVDGRILIAGTLITSQIPLFSLYTRLYSVHTNKWSMK